MGSLLLIAQDALRSKVDGDGLTDAERRDTTPAERAQALRDKVGRGEKLSALEELRLAKLNFDEHLRATATPIEMN